MKSPIVILNRAGLASAGGWIHIVPMGQLSNPDAGVVQILDDTALDSIMSNIAADKARLGEKWPGIYAGREHFIYDASQDSAALAWFKDFEKRPDGIWANDNGLTPVGRTAIQNGEYKFTSFCADPDDLQRIPGQSVGGLPCYRVIAIDTVGFTNQANGKEMLTPITNRAMTSSVHAAGADPFPTPDLDKWFEAVYAIQHSAGIHAHVALDWATAWEMARQQFPDVYATAFPTTKRDGVDDEDVDDGAARVSALANRIGKDSKKGFKFGWEFVQKNIPAIFNRSLSKSKVILNRASAKQNPQIAQQKAADYFTVLAKIEQVTNGVSQSYAWQIVTNRRPALARLAMGQINTELAIAQDPDLRERLID
jgi:hypothetical protein